MIVGIAGYAGSGKDTAADGLAEVPGWRKDSLAAPLKAMAYDISPLVRTDLDGWPVIARLSDVVDLFGWDGAKQISDVREFLQRLGAEGVRRHMGPDTLLKMAYDRHLAANNEAYKRGQFVDTVIPDVRFANEASLCRILIWIDRPGVEPPNNHPSESGEVRELATHTIVNDGTVNQLQRNVRKVVLGSGDR